MIGMMATDLGPEKRPKVVTLEYIGLALLFLVALALMHALLYHLHYVLSPFVLSGFIVFAVEPSVDVLFRHFAGLVPPHRWCFCCATRRRRHTRWAFGASLRYGNEPEASEALDRPTDEAQVADAEQAESLGETEALLDGPPGSWTELIVLVGEGASRFFAVAIVLSGMVLMAVAFVSLLARGAMQMKQNWSDYQAGVSRLLKQFNQLADFVTHQLHLSGVVDERVKTIYSNALSSAQDTILQVVNGLVAGISWSVSSMVIMLLYLFFWLLQPLPIGGKASTLVRRYIWKKTLVSLLYGSCVALLFLILGIDLAMFFGAVSFCLNYVPEVGPFISMLVPVPVILLDGRIESPARTLIVATLGQMVLKFLFGNVLEMKLIEHDREMSIHPIWVILGLNYFGFVWGPTGMLISVPLLAMVKSVALSVATTPDGEAAVTSEWASWVFWCLEGRRRPDAGTTTSLMEPDAALLKRERPSARGGSDSVSFADAQAHSKTTKAKALGRPAAELSMPTEERDDPT